MEIQQLRYFLAIVDEGNLTKASKKLNTVQSNVTVKIKQLEYELGHELFSRSKQGMKLTERGHTLLEHARSILETQSNIKRIMDSDLLPAGRLSIACLDTFIRLYLKKIIPIYVRSQPAVSLELQTGFNPDLFKMLDEGSADLIGIVGKSETSAYECVFSQKERLILISKKHSIEDQPILILGKACFFGQTLTEYFNHSRKVLTIASIDSIIASVNASIGITLLPESLTTLTQCKSLEKKTINATCDYSLLRKKNRPKSLAEQEFIKLLKLKTQ